VSDKIHTLIEARMTKQKPKEKPMPKCPSDCMGAHTLRVAMFLLGVGRTTLYDLMNARKIEYVNDGHGRRIRHDVINSYLKTHTVR